MVLPLSAFRRLFLILLSLPAMVYAESAAFDLPGPRVEVRVTRGGKQLPISQVPNLQEGDRLWLHPAFPETQIAHYLLIATFLRGSTNPPPENWFTKIETWDKHVRSEGVIVTVPQGAEQALLFLAPETGGDFNTLRTTVRGKPGAFVRATQDLDRASLDRSRLEVYLSAVKHASDTDPSELKEKSALLARSLNLKVDSKCFEKPEEQQMPCLMQNSDQLVLDDSHSQSMVSELASGPSADLAGQLSATPWAGGGFYSAYVGAIVDVARLMASLRTAQYQYIPALALPKTDLLDLQLNAAPSFRKPKSVLVIGLPPVAAPQLPPLRAVDPKAVSCLQRSSLVLPAEGAPLVFSTNLAHDLVLHVSSKSGTSMDFPAKADAARGGFVVDTDAVKSKGIDPEVSGTLRGQWGFESFEGPTFHLRTSHSAPWTIAAADQTSLVVGRDDVLHLHSDAAACVEDVSVEDEHGKKLKTTQKMVSADEVQVEISLKDAAPGPLTIRVKQFGLAKPDEVALHTYSEAGRVDSFTIDAGDRQGLLKGSRLDEVEGLEVGGIHFSPAGLKRAGNEDELQLSAPGTADVSGFHSGEKQTAHVSLKDGRALDVAATVQPPRPKLTLLNKNIQPDATATSSAIRLEGQDELPQNAKLAFSLKTQVPETFSRDEKVEVAAEDESVHVLLSLADGTLTLQDSQTVLATLDPLKSFGPSAFGPLRFRPVGANGDKGDWQPLVTLVRLPALTELRCPDASDQQCTLQGTGLYLLDSVSTDAQFQQSVPVPDGFAGSTLTVPHPTGTELYVKLRDDRTAINKVILPVVPEK
jgi:hypothetical protein